MVPTVVAVTARVRSTAAGNQPNAGALRAEFSATAGRPMMDESRLPDDVRRFLLAAIASVPHLEALLLLRDDAPRAWTGAEVATRLYTDPASAQQLLLDLAERGLVERTGGDFIYAPRDPATRATIDTLASLYSRHVVLIARLIHARHDRAARHFADAFRVRKES